MSVTSRRPPLRQLTAGPRGRLLVGLFLMELGSAVQLVAQTSVLPLAARELHGARWYGAAVTGPTLSAIAFILLGPKLHHRLTVGSTLALSLGVYLFGVGLTVLAPTMVFVVLGRLCEGAAAGLLSGFGLRALGVLFDDEERPRVLGLMSAAWLLPSLLGPVVNSAIALAGGWRWALAWPVVLVVAGRLAMRGALRLLPAPDGPPPIPLMSGAFTLGGLALATVSTRLDGSPRLLGYAFGLTVAAGGALKVIYHLTGRSCHRRSLLAVLFLVCTAYYGAEGLLSLSIIETTTAGVVGASVAYGVGGAAWSLTSMTNVGGSRPRTTTSIGVAVVAVGLAGLTVATGATRLGDRALVVMVLSWAWASIGIGLCYYLLMSATLDTVGANDAPAVGSALAFAETIAAAAAGLLGGGSYSLLIGSATTRTSLTITFAVLSLLAAAAVVIVVLPASRNPRSASRG